MREAPQKGGIRLGRPRNRIEMITLALAVSSVLSISSSSALPAAEDLNFKVVPGTTTMSVEERAIVRDPSKGYLHAVILAEERIRDDSDILYPKMAYHLRAKILSNEARDLADVEIPVNPRSDYLLEWWGRTILPDGAVLEVGREGVEEHVVVKGGGLRHSVLRAALPGVAAGCVIDYGYAFRGTGVGLISLVALQGPAPIELFRFRWLPSPRDPPAHQLVAAEGLDLTIDATRNRLVVIGRNLPPAVSEPFMPKGAGQARLILGYFMRKGDHDALLDRRARGLERAARSFCGGRQGEKAVREAIAGMEIPPAADLDGRLRAAYDWLVPRVVASPPEAPDETGLRWRGGMTERRPDPTIQQVLGGAPAKEQLLDHLFLCVARALGAEANLLLIKRRDLLMPGPHSADRADREETVVAVRRPGDPVLRMSLVDLGSGLPYGEVPWRLATDDGLLIREDGARKIELPPSAPERNASRTEVRIDLGGADGVAEVVWVQRATGEHGLRHGLAVSRFVGDARRKELERLCGSGSRVEVSRAESPEPGEDLSRTEFTCELRASGTAIDEVVRRYQHGIGGPWLEPVPYLPAGPRVHPVAFEYARHDAAAIDVRAPSGFEPDAPPQPLKLESPFGRYSLAVTRTETGYTVEREFTLSALRVETADYERLREFLHGVRIADDTMLDFKRSQSPAP